MCVYNCTTSTTLGRPNASSYVMITESDTNRIYDRISRYMEPLLHHLAYIYETSLDFVTPSSIGKCAYLHKQNTIWRYL